jgi:hypothetical protein
MTIIESKDTNLEPGHIPPLSNESYMQKRFSNDVLRAQENQAKLKPQVDKSHITPLRDRKVTEKLISYFGGKVPEATVSHEKEPQEYIFKFNDKSRFILYAGKDKNVTDIAVKENLPERIIIDFTKMTEAGQQINSKYVVTQPLDGKPEAGTIYLRMYDLDKNGNYYSTHLGFKPEFQAEELAFSDRTKADLIQKGLLETK